MHYDIFLLMDFLDEMKGTSLHLAVEQCPVYSVGGRSRSIKGPALTREDTTRLSNQVLSESHKLTLRETGRAEFADRAPSSPTEVSCVMSSALERLTEAPIHFTLSAP